jgi:eukaryotic-like serine/threonine-protein kinase
VAGTLVGRYELEYPLGRGAMGEVWRGRDLATRQPVAVKLVQLANIDDQVQVGETIARFRREADTLARLRHPNIISALEAGRVGSELFMVMELAEGMSMQAMLRQRQANGLGMFPVESVLRIAKQACSGLAAAHAIGVVHRDIKPSNLMVSARGHLTIVDFGIARLLEDNSPRLTAPTQTIGSPLYMSPEQTMGIDVDGRSDLYSFGCVLYELLAGRPPFVAELPIAVMRMHLEERPVPIRHVRSDLPHGLPELVDRLLEKDRDARPPDAGYVLRGLVGISGNFTGSAVPEHEADRSTFLVGAADTVRGAWPPPPADPVPEPYRATLVADDPPQWPGQGPGPEDKGKRRGSGGPDGWPTARPRRRRRRWAGVLSSLLTVVIVAGIAGYVWTKTHQSLKITAATVSVTNPGKIACNSTVDVVGTISTNGKGGPVTYQWTKDGQNLPAGTVTATSGQPQVRVELQWYLAGKGIHHAVAIFQVFTPNVISAQSASFTYTCAK